MSTAVYLKGESWNVSTAEHSSVILLLVQLFMKTDFSRHALWFSAATFWNLLHFLSVTGIF